MLNIDFVDTLARKDVGLHVLITDSCKDVDLYDNKDKITELQKESMTHNQLARNFILYINKNVLDEFTFAGTSEIPLKCPACNRDYKLTKEAYDLAFNKYLEEF